MPTVEERLTALEGRATPEHLRWIADAPDAYRMVLAVPGQPVQTLLHIRKDGDGTWALVFGDILPTHYSGEFRRNYNRGLPDFMALGREPGAPYSTAVWCGSLLMGGANDGAELSFFLTGSPDRAALYSEHAGAIGKINGVSWDPDNGMITSSMIVIHTEEFATLGHHPGLISMYTGAPNDPGPPVLGWRMQPGGKVTQRTPLASVFNSVPQATQDGIEKLLSWDRVEANNDGMWLAATPWRLYARYAGVHRAWASLAWASSPPSHSVILRKNGAAIVGRGPGVDGLAYTSTEVTLAAGEWIDVWASQQGSGPDILDSSRAGLTFVSL